VYLDAVRAHAGASDASPEYEPLRKWTSLPIQETLVDRELDLAARSVAKQAYAQKVTPSCAVSQQVGNCYTASVYVNLATLVHTMGAALAGKRVLLFSYGSGSIASMFTIRARNPTAKGGKYTLEKMAQVLDFPAKLAGRSVRSPEEYTAIMKLRELAYTAASAASGNTPVELTQSVSSIAPGAFYLESIDAIGRREYKRRPAVSELNGTTSEETSDLARVTNRSHRLAGAVYVAGTSAGFPGVKTATAASPFSVEALDAVLQGQNCIEPLSDEMVSAQLDLNIVQHRKSKAAGTTTTTRVESRDQCVQVAAVMPRVDLTSPEFGLPAVMVSGMDEATQLAVAAGLKALESAKLVGVSEGENPSWRLPEKLRDSTGIIYATSYPTMQAAVAEAVRFHKSKAGEDSAYELDRKLLFKLLVLANAQLAQITGARGPNTQMNAACAGASQAIGIAQHWITTRKCERVLVVSSDCASSRELFPWIGGGFRVLGAASTASTAEGAARPFDVKRNGMIVGAGAIGVVLESPASHNARAVVSIHPERKVKLLASHFSNSAYHGASLDPEHVGKELDLLLSRVEREFGVSRAQFAAHGVYYSHETGTNASPTTSCAFAEVTALRSALGDDLLRQLVIANTKGITGHPMAVSFEDVVAVESLRRGVVPPVVNFSSHDDHLGTKPLNLAKGGAHPHKYALRFAAGFGSQLAFTFYALED
jgi:3-oxoacyl-(acyl-carrier-protein) synthase